MAALDGKPAPARRVAFRDGRRRSGIVWLMWFIMVGFRGCGHGQKLALVTRAGKSGERQILSSPAGGTRPKRDGGA